MDYDELEEKMCQFKMYLKQTNDLLNDAYRWKVMAENCKDEEMKNKYMSVSNTLFDLFLTEHNRISEMFKNM